MRAMGRRVGVDLGGTRIKAGVVDETGRLVEGTQRATPSKDGPEAVLDAVAATVAELGVRPEVIGFAIPGHVDAEGRCWRLPNLSGFEGVPLGAGLGGRLGCRVVVENDATLAALGELRHGFGRETRSFLLLTLGTGIGGGLVLDGALRRGAHGFAGEFGHVVIERGPEGWPCVCGQTGCVEAYAGTYGMVRKAQSLGLGTDSIRRLAELAAAGDAGAQAVFESAGNALGEGLASAQNLLDLDAIVLAGGISASFGLMESAARAALRRRAFSGPLGEVPFRVSRLGGSAGIVGAAVLARETTA